MAVTVTMKEGMQFVAHTPSGHDIVIDSAPEVGGSNAGPGPMELLASAIGSCTAMDVISVLLKMQEDVTGLEVHVDGERAAEHPKKYLNIHLEYVVTGYNLAEDKVARAIELSETRYCSVMATVRPGAPITTSYRIVEASGAELPSA